MVENVVTNIVEAGRRISDREKAGGRMSRNGCSRNIEVLKKIVERNRVNGKRRDKHRGSWSWNNDCGK